MKYLLEEIGKVRNAFFLTAILFFLQVFSSLNAYASVLCVQEFLSKTIFNPGVVDGQWGKKTETAAKDYLNYIGQKVDFSIGQKNSKVICDQLNSYKGSKPKLKYRKFHISINKDELAKFSGRKTFNFDNYKLSTDFPDEVCTFKIYRKSLKSKNKKPDVMASGSLAIKEGRIFFQKNQWFTGGLADSSYLKEEAFLAVLENKALVGIMPHFRTHVKPGGLAVRPNMIEFNKIKPTKKTSFLRYDYYVDDWSSGALEIRGCRAKALGEGLVAQNFYLDRTYNKKGCRFTIEREVMGYIEAKGNLDIQNGKLVFFNTEWPRAEEKNDHFLEKETSLGIGEDGSLVGSMTYLASSGIPERINFNKTKKNKYGFSFSFETKEAGEGYTSVRVIKRNLNLILCRKELKLDVDLKDVFNFKFDSESN